MKTKRKEKKRREKDTARIRSRDLSAHRTKALPPGHVEHTFRLMEFFLLKTSSLIKHKFKDIFQKNDCSLDSETQRKCISSHLHVENGSQTV